MTVTATGPRRPRWGALFCPRGRRTARTLFLVGLLTLLAGPEQGRCHVTDTDMPDAVAETEYQILLEFEPGKTEIRNKLAMVLLRKKRYTEAEKELRTVLAAEPTNYNALDGLGLVMTRTGKVREAVDHFLAAIKANPQDVMVHYHLGQAYAALGDHEAARKAYRQALALASQPAAGPTSAADLATIRQALEQSPGLQSAPLSPPAQ